MEENKPASGNTQEGNQPSATSLIEQANSAREKLEQTHAVVLNDIKRLEELQARTILGGGSSAGQSTVAQPTEADKKKVEALNFWKGTGIDKAIEKYGH